MARVKLFITIDVDEEEYPVPADGQVGEEIEDGKRMNSEERHGVKLYQDILITCLSTCRIAVTTCCRIH